MSELTEAEREALAQAIADADIPILIGWKLGWLRALAEGIAPLLTDAHAAGVAEGRAEKDREAFIRGADVVLRRVREYLSDNPNAYGSDLLDALNDALPESVAALAGASPQGEGER